MRPESHSTASLLLPERNTVDELLNLEFGGGVGDILDPALLIPVADLVSRPSKEIRGSLVKVGFQFGQPAVAEDGARREICTQILELLHAGSLAIDDIEDDSAMRRGSPSLHRKFGTPIALNAGNWLYFWPLEKVAELNLSPERELAVYRHYHRSLLRAHLGQAIDLGTRLGDLPQTSVEKVCLASLELKTGALTALALLLGGTVSGARPEICAALGRFGHGFGIALQMFDDIGNVLGQKDPQKRWEDLRLGRPSWVWAYAARTCSAPDYAEFIRAASALTESAAPVQRWLGERPEFLADCKRVATEFLRATIDRVGEETSALGNFSQGLASIATLGQALVDAY